MTPLNLYEITPGKYSLLLNAGTTAVDGLILELGFEPSGYFWEGVAKLLTLQHPAALEGRFGLDPEAGMFCAYGTDPAALEELGRLMAEVANDPERLREVVAEAEEAGVGFDD